MRSHLVHRFTASRVRPFPPRAPVAAATAAAAAALGMLALPVQAAAVDAGMNLQQPVPPTPAVSDPAAVPATLAPTTSTPAAGGATVALKGVTIEGNTWIDTPTLLAALGDVTGRPYDMAGLHALAARVSDVYREQGFAFVRTLLPPQDLTAGTLRLRVVEAVYGKVVLKGKDPLTPQAQPHLDQLLPVGEAIRSDNLERAMLLLDDQPGFDVRPVLQPGEGLGEGDLHVTLLRQRHVSGEIGVDNAGSRATGEVRARASVSVLSPWRLGDKVSISGLVTDQGMWLGSAEYESPLGSLAWRGAVSAARTSYQVDGGGTTLDTRGRADVLSLRTSWTAVRSQRMNLLLGATLQHKALHDDFGSGLLLRDKSSQGVQLSAQFDLRDGLGGGGVTYGVTSLTSGRLHLDAATAPSDAATARTAGSFSKLNVDIARIQHLPAGFSAYARFSGQWTDGNLDASEKFAIGGYLGVRAYPMGEGNGDRGWLGQLELRRSLTPQLTLFALIDQGQVQVNARPWAGAGANPSRTLAGVGAGVRWTQRAWSVEATVASRTAGGAPTSDTADRQPRGYLVVSHRFD